MISIRLPLNDYLLIRKQALRHGLSPTEWVRLAAVTTAQSVQEEYGDDAHF